MDIFCRVPDYQRINNFKVIRADFLSCFYINKSVFRISMQIVRFQIDKKLFLYNTHTMAIKFLLLVSRQGKVRLTKWFDSDWTLKEKNKVVKDVSHTVLQRKPTMCNVVDYSHYKVVYKRLLKVIKVCVAVFYSRN